MPRPRSLTQTQIAEAALTVIDRDGLAGLSMRAVAKVLGMSTMALYRYVDDRHELEGLVVELVLGAVDPTPPPAAPWRARIEELVERLRTVIVAHPEVIPLTMTHRHSSHALLRWSEAVAGTLAEAGIEGARRAIALRGLLGYVIGAIQLEHRGPLSGPGTSAIADLPSDTFPNMAETARSARGVTPDEEFRGGLSLLLNGITSDQS
ncbi:TetR/AcrR family transcriptional regulator [Actinomadura sp. 6N118]|uniref:TetR/AcrR family transcriptional regulator n=1 Tax=Actinomadura sp. 6N118 TaxID=3375151 RepID=UPI0037A19FD5